jgi:uncharacterized membrane protein YhhN
METAVMAASWANAIIFGVNVRKPPGLFRTITKTASTTLLSAATFIRGGSLTLTGALALGSLGDAFLALDEGDAAFLSGLSSFLAAHLLYIAEFLPAGNGRTQIESEGWRKVLAAAMLLLGPAMNAPLMSRVGRPLRVPVMVYSAVIVCMTLTALTIDNSRVVWGAILFAMSDSILAADRFLVAKTSPFRPLMQYAVWVLYYSGQFLIAMGLSGRSVDH